MPHSGPETSAPEAAHPAAPSRAAALGLLVVLSLWTAITLARVVPYLSVSGGDFENLHRGARALVAGESAFVRPELDYPPLVPVLLAPLGPRALEDAREIWLGISLAAIVAAVAILWRRAGGDLPATAAVALVLAVDGSAAPNLALGQFQPLLLLLLALALFLLPRGTTAAASAIGAATALKVWPGLLFFAWTAARSDERRRAWLGGGATVLLLCLIPWLVLRLATPPPHLPTAHGYWLGTPASLNFSVPAAALRASYGWRAGNPTPADWSAGVTSAWSLAPGFQRLSVTVSLTLLGAGLAAIWLRIRRTGRPSADSGPTAEPEAGASADPTPILLALVALALLAAPISWYHYQLVQLPAFLLAATAAFRRRQVVPALLIAATLAALTHHEWIDSAIAATCATCTPETSLYLTGIALPLLGLAWFAFRLLSIGAVANRL